VLDRILAPVLKAVGGSVRTERFFASATEGGDGLAASRLDYAVYRNPAKAGDTPQLIAIVEAKRSGGDLNQVRCSLFANRPASFSNPTHRCSGTLRSVPFTVGLCLWL